MKLALAQMEAKKNLRGFGTLSLQKSLIEKQRAYCSARARRIHWIKEIIDAVGVEEHIKYFYEDNGAKTHFLWDTKRFYIVLIKHLGRSNNLLVTAYSVHKNKYRDYKRRLKKYEEGL